MPYPVAACRGRSFASSAAPLPTANLIYAWTADSEYVLDNDDAAATVGVAVKTWRAINAAVDFEQTIGDSQPTYTEENGVGWLEADGTDDSMAGPAAFNIGDYDSGLTVYWRSKYGGSVSEATYRWLIAHYSGEGARWFVGKTTGSGTLHTALPSLSGYGPADRTGAAFVQDADEKWCMTYTPGSTVTLHRNGTLVHTASSVGSTLGSFRCALFAANASEVGGGAQFWVGKIRHLAAYSVSHNATQRAAALAYLDT